MDAKAPSDVSISVLPPGQHIVHDWPVLTAGLTPTSPAEDDWSFSVEGLVGRPTTWSLDELRAMRSERTFVDLHCVTGWSRLGVSIEGIRLSELLARCAPSSEAHFISAISCDGYDANIPLDFALDKAWLVWTVDGQPLGRSHGGPLRLVVEDRYFWKSVKWLFSVRLVADDQPGYWETRGYHNVGDPWSEQRNVIQPRWETCIVVGARAQTPTLRTIDLQAAKWGGHKPGQHVRVRVRLADGSTADRAYSISSRSSDDRFEITVDRLDGGQVSPVLHSLDIGKAIEFSGPYGTEFQGASDAPALYLAAGSGVSPLMSMRRAAQHENSPDHHLILSVRTPDDLPYAAEMSSDVTVCYTRQAPAGHPRAVGRLTVDDVRVVAAPEGYAYVCGPSSFVDLAGGLLLECGYPAERIRTQRYGPG